MTYHMRREFVPQAASGGAAEKKFKVVVLNAWGSFGEHGEREILEDAGCEIEVRTAATDEERQQAVRDADGLYYTGPVTRGMLRSMDRCRVIAESAIGMDTFEDFDLATEKVQVIRCEQISELLDHNGPVAMAWNPAGTAIVCRLPAFVSSAATISGELPPKHFGDSEIFIIPREGKARWFVVG